MYYVLGILGLIAIVGGAISLRRGLQSSRWPTVKGSVVSATIETEHSQDSPGAAFYTPRVTYRYEVAGTPYEGTKISAKSYGTGNREEIQKIVDQYQRAPEVSVYYNPQKPEISLLQTGVGFVSFLPIIIGTLMVVISVLGLAGIMTFDVG